MSRGKKSIFAPVRFPAENPVNFVHVELRRPVVIINTVLFLLNIGELGVAVAADILEIDQHIGLIADSAECFCPAGGIKAVSP